MHCTQRSHKTLSCRVFQKSAAMWLFLKLLHLSERHQLILCSMEYQHRLRQAAWLPGLCKRNFSCKACTSVSSLPDPFASGWASPRARKIGDSSSNVSFPKRSCSAKVPSHVPQKEANLRPVANSHVNFIDSEKGNKQKPFLFTIPAVEKFMSLDFFQRTTFSALAHHRRSCQLSRNWRSNTGLKRKSLSSCHPNTQSN